MEIAVEIDHYYFNYQAIGCPHHPAILFLHGFMGDCHEFDAVMALLSDQFYCLAIDLPGHGNTQVRDDQDYTMANTAYGIIQFLKVLQIQPCFLVGYSMGGRLALYLTLQFPSLFLKTILESASPGLKTSTERDQRMLRDLDLAKALEADFPSFLVKWYQQPLFASLRNHTDFQALLQQRLKNNPRHLATALCRLSTGCQPSLWDKLHQNTVPIQLLVGELDPKFVDINTEMSQVGNFMQLIIIQHCGHNIHLEDSQSFVDRIRAFLHRS